MPTFALDTVSPPRFAARAATAPNHMRILALDGDENACVASVRSLHAAGYSVIVGAPHRWSKAAVSRHCAGIFTHTPVQESAEAFARQIAHEAGREPGTLIIAHTEATTMALSQYRELLLEHSARFVLPPHNTLLVAVNKAETTALAERLGLTVPRTVTLETTEEARATARRIGYPTVLKARQSQELCASGSVKATGRPEYARNAREFMEGYTKLSASSGSVIAQEFVSGRGTGYFVLMNHGELRAEFAHLRIRDVHPTGSGSALRISIRPLAAVREASLRLLQALHFHGVGMVEFRLRDDGIPVFIELNPRFWNSLPLAIYAGVDFPVLLAEMAQKGDIEPQQTYRTNVRCRWIMGDCSHLAQVLWGKPKHFPGCFPRRWHTLREFFTPRRNTYHDLFLLRDPLPEIADWLRYTMKLARAIGGQVLGATARQGVSILPQ
ncbi:MAG TPA: ATP-grasp domain-containing protein [Terriglobales bacterium]|nr:ATP-grasp domain-containing protein [Terriglobales bacterium]